MLKRDSSEITAFGHSARQWRRSRAYCSLRRWWSLDNGSRCNGMRDTSPALKIWRRTVEADRSKPVAVLQRRLNLMKLYGPSRPCRQDDGHPVLWSHYVAQYLLVSKYDPRSLHWFHTHITIVAACPVRAEMSRYDTLAFRRPTILPRSNALTCWYCAISRRRGIPALAFTFQLCLEALHWLNKA